MLNVLHHINPFYLSIPPVNIKKPLIFLIFSGGIARNQCHEMGQSFLLSEYFRVIEVQLVRVIEDRRQISLQILSELINPIPPEIMRRLYVF